MSLIKDAESKKFDAVVFTRLSRFARNAGDFLHYRDKLSKYGIQLLSIKEGIDPTTHTGRLAMGMLALIAEWEREIIRENMAENKLAKWRENRLFNGRPPYGYRWNKTLNRLEIVPDEAEIYKRIISLYLDQGRSYKDIAILFNDEGLKCKKAPFSSAVIGYMFKNPVYYGHYVTNQHKYIEGKRSKVLKPASEHIEYKDVPAIISKDLWDRVQQKISFNKVKAKRTDWTKDYFLRDLLVCGRCGRKIHAHAGSLRMNGERSRYYSCYLAGTSLKKAKEMRAKKCSLPFIKASEIENEVWRDLTLTLAVGNFKAIKEAFGIDKLTATTRTLEKQLKNLEMDLTRKNTAREKLYALLENPSADINEVQGRLASNKDAIITLKSKIEEANNQLQRSQDALKQYATLRDFAKNKTLLSQMAKELKELEPIDKKQILEGIIDNKINVDVNEENLHLNYKFRWNPDVFQQLINKGKFKFIKGGGGSNSSFNQYSGQALCQHGLAGPGRTDHEQVIDVETHT
jgi:site-specific DNA recombinase